MTCLQGSEVVAHSDEVVRAVFAQLRLVLSRSVQRALLVELLRRHRVDARRRHRRVALAVRGVGGGGRHEERKRRRLLLARERSFDGREHTRFARMPTRVHPLGQRGRRDRTLEHRRGILERRLAVRCGHLLNEWLQVQALHRKPDQRIDLSSLVSVLRTSTVQYSKCAQ